MFYQLFNITRFAYVCLQRAAMYREPSVLCMRWEHSHCLLSGPIKALNPSRTAGWTSICSMRLTKKTSKVSRDLEQMHLLAYHATCRTWATS